MQPMTFHKDIYLPVTDRPVDGLALDYSRHALEQSLSKRIDLPRQLPRVFEVVEVTIGEKGQPTKFVVRFASTKVNVDTVLVLRPWGFVLTAWENNVLDRHATLDRSKYVAPPLQ